MDISEEVNTLIELAWNKEIDDDTRGSMRSHFEFMNEADWNELKGHIACSTTVQRIIDTVDTLRDMNKALVDD